MYVTNEGYLFFGSPIMEKNWIAYRCMSGETLFIYNKETGEHKWPHALRQVLKYAFLKFHIEGA